MIELPETTRVHRRIPKEAFYKHLTISGALKEKFVSDIDRLYVEYSLTKDNLNLEKESDIKEILVMLIELKKKEYEGKLLEAIARQNPHKLLFILSYNEEKRYAIYQGKLYQTEWKKESEVQINTEGFSLNSIWDHFVEQIALENEECTSNYLTVEQRLKRQEQIDKLNKLIEKTMALAWREQQPKKKFELYQRAQSYKKELEKIKNGQA